MEKTSNFISRDTHNSSKHETDKDRTSWTNGSDRHHNRLSVHKISSGSKQVSRGKPSCQFPYNNINYHGGITGFFIHWLDKRDKKQGKTEQNITTHTSTLIEEFNSQRDIFQPHDKGWKKFLKTFQYSTEFKEHVCTGHEELYEKLEALIQIEKKSEIQEQFYNRISDKVRTDCGNMGIGYSNNDPPPWFDQRSLLMEIFSNFDMKNLKLLKLKQDGYPKSWLLDYYGGGHRLNEMDEDLSKKLLAYLNSILMDKSLKKEFEEYQLVRDELIPTRKEFESDLDDLLKGIGLLASELKGACSYCLKWYDGKTKKNFQSKISRITQPSVD